METIMSKTNSESRNVREPKERELRDDELALVSGGQNAGENAGGGLVHLANMRHEMLKTVAQNLRA
jgi:hypothetical protein